MLSESQQTLADMPPAVEAQPITAGEAQRESEDGEEQSVRPTEESGSVDGGAEPEKVVSIGSTPNWCSNLLIAGVLFALAATGFVSDLVRQGLVSHRGGAVMLSALAASNASLGWATSLFTFVFSVSTSLIGRAVGAGNDLKAGRFARLSVAMALVIGVVGTLVLVLCRTSVLGLFDQEAVAEQAQDLFTLQALCFWLVILCLALNGIMLGFMYIHVALGIIVLGCGIALFLSFTLFLLTELGLQAFGIASAAGGFASAALSMIFLLRGPGRKKFGLDLGLSGISLADLRELGRSMSCLAFRSFVVGTQPMVSIMLAIRMSPVHGAVLQFLVTQSGVVDRIVGGFALGITFMGARLWGGNYYGAFWCVVFGFAGYICTPLAISFAIVELIRGRSSLADIFADGAERADFDAVMTGRTFAVYILILIARAYYSTIEQALIAMQEVWWLALIQGISFAAFLSVALSGYILRDFSMLLLGGLVFLLCRIAGGAWVLLRGLRVHPPEKYRRGTLTDPEYALKQTIDDPFIAKVFGARQTRRSNEQSRVERV